MIAESSTRPSRRSCLAGGGGKGLDPLNELGRLHGFADAPPDGGLGIVVDPLIRRLRSARGIGIEKAVRLPVRIAIPRNLRIIEAVVGGLSRRCGFLAHDGWWNVAGRAEGASQPLPPGSTFRTVRMTDETRDRRQRSGIFH